VVSPVQMFLEGGGFQFPVLALGMFAMLFALIIPLAIGFAKWRVPASLALLGPVGVVATGLLGTLFGMQQAWQAHAVASAEVKDTLLAAGASVALYTLLFATVMMIAAAVLACFAAAIPAVAAVGPQPRVDVRGLLAAAGGAMGAFVVAVILCVSVVGLGELAELGLALPVGLLICALVTLLTIVACGRIASEDPLHQGRIAGSRFFIAMCGALALILLGEFLRSAGQSNAARALAVASAEVKAMMVYQSQQGASNGAWLGWLLALVPMTAGTCGALHWVKRIDGRGGVGAVISLVSIVLILVMMYAARSASVHQVAGLW
jgi:hypothetical protein